MKTLIVRLTGANDQEKLQNSELLLANDHAVVDSGRPPSEPQGSTNK
jgi:hypothetical protein